MRITLKVSTNSKKVEVIKISENEYHIKFFAVREHGRANEKLIEILSKQFKVPKTSIKIVSGQNSSIKIIEL